MDGTDYLVSAHGVRTPRILYGTAWKRERTEALVQAALGLGFRGIDTACQPKHYDEAGVGAAVAAARAAGLAREALYLQTKFTPLGGQDPARVPYDPAAPPAAQVAESFRASQRNLQVPWVDCLVLHTALPDRRELAVVWQAMEAIFDAGGARQLGISNCYSLEYLEALCASARVRPAVVQNRFHAATGYDRGIRAYCRLNGICYQSFWTLTANPHLLADPLVTGLAARHAHTPAQVLFRYLTQQQVVPLTGTTSAAHMREDLGIFAFALEDAELAALTALLAPAP